MALEYRVVWKRYGCDQRSRRYATLAGASRFMLLFGDEPWTAFPKKPSPDDLVCCSGRECACGGLTYRQESEQKRENMPALVYIRLESREVGEWGFQKEEQP